MLEDRAEGERAKQRSAEEWSSVPEIWALLAAVAKRYGLSAPDGEDILQETLITLLRAGPNVHACRTWILKVAARKAIDIVRSGAATANREDSYARSRAPTDETQELQHLLHVRADQIPSRLRSLYDLRYVRGLTEREAAAGLDIGRSSFRRLDRQFRRAIAKKPHRGRQTLGDPSG